MATTSSSEYSSSSTATAQRKVMRVDPTKIAGNAPFEVKQKLANVSEYFEQFAPERFKGMNIFGKSIFERFEITEISVERKRDGEKKMEGRVVLELDVAEDMINGGGNIHGGCSAFLVDVCSSLSLSALSLVTEGKEYLSVSQAINMIYHSPAVLGERLRIVNTSMVMGNRTHTCRTEIWNATQDRLVASGTHVKMAPSPPPTKPKL